MSEQHAPLNWNLIEIGIRVVFINDLFNNRHAYDNHPDVYGQHGTIRKIDYENHKFWITWDVEYYNSMYRGLRLLA